DIIIKTASRENVLVIPEEAVEKKDGKAIVQVLIGKTLQEREIEIGLIGSDDMVEVISGLKEGEEVVIK
ncbi:efflux transporter periplasmic adaptor subunit, partial [Patescibacteria group bacterium]|nr:efflux transporter periplasmic adaptor subunit [Patescibacteria group bacterium]